MQEWANADILNDEVQSGIFAVPSKGFTLQGLDLERRTLLNETIDGDLIPGDFPAQWFRIEARSAPEATAEMKTNKSTSATETEPRRAPLHPPTAQKTVVPTDHKTRADSVETRLQKRRDKQVAPPPPEKPNPSRGVKSTILLGSASFPVLSGVSLLAGEAWGQPEPYVLQNILMDVGLILASIPFAYRAFARNRHLGLAARGVCAVFIATYAFFAVNPVF